MSLQQGSFVGSDSYVARVNVIASDSSVCKHVVLVGLDSSDPDAVGKTYGTQISKISKQLKAKNVSTFLPASNAPDDTFKVSRT
jgi:hypothetical protein